MHTISYYTVRESADFADAVTQLPDPFQAGVNIG